MLERAEGGDEAGVHIAHPGAVDPAVLDRARDGVARPAVALADLVGVEVAVERQVWAVLGRAARAVERGDDVRALGRRGDGLVVDPAGVESVPEQVGDRPRVARRGRARGGDELTQEREQVLGPVAGGGDHGGRGEGVGSRHRPVIRSTSVSRTATSNRPPATRTNTTLMTFTSGVTP